MTAKTKILRLLSQIQRSKKDPRSQKKSKNSNSDEDYNLDMDRGLNLAITKLDNRLLADYVAKRTKRFCPDLSLVELEDRYISGVSCGSS